MTEISIKMFRKRDKLKIENEEEGIKFNGEKYKNATKNGKNFIYNLIFWLFVIILILIALNKMLPTTKTTSTPQNFVQIVEINRNEGANNNQNIVLNQLNALVNNPLLVVNVVNSPLPSIPFRKGLSPSQKIVEEENEFYCKDLTQKFPKSFFNDDYCDCEDGSDEPATSACSFVSPSSLFYCENEISFEQSINLDLVPTPASFIFSSFVNDGVCDCCDGSDEWKTPGLCPNTCGRFKT